MDNALTLFLLALAMWAGAIISGLVPTVVPKSPKILMILNLIGAGLLFGVAVGVLVPEAVIFIYDSSLHHEEGGDESEHSELIKDINDLGIHTFTKSCRY